MKKCIPLYSCILVLLGMFAVHSPAWTQEYYDEGDDSYGYTTLSWNMTNNSVVGYTETDMDDGFADYYEAVAYGRLTDSTGKLLAAQSMTDTGDQGYASVTLTITGTLGQTYTMTGEHGGSLGFQDDVEGSKFDDGYDIYYWTQYLFDMPDVFQFYEGGPPQRTAQQEIWVGYTSSTASLKTAAPCGDQRDTIIKEYTQYSVSLQPVCSSFTQTAPVNAYFSFAQLNSGNYIWAILMASLSNTTSIANNYSGTLTATSGYRNPAKEYSVDTSQGAAFTRNSRHEYGDAVDLASNSSTFALLRNTAITDANACAEPLANSTSAHVHVDWRHLDGASCPSLWRTVNK